MYTRSVGFSRRFACSEVVSVYALVIRLVPLVCSACMSQTTLIWIPHYSLVFRSTDSSFRRQTICLYYESTVLFLLAYEFQFPT